MISYAHFLGETTRVRGPYPGEKSGNESSFRAPPLTPHFNVDWLADVQVEWAADSTQPTLPTLSSGGRGGQGEKLPRFLREYFLW